MLLILAYLFSVVIANSDLVIGEHFHVSIQFKHMDMRTDWIVFPQNRLPLFMKSSNTTILLSMSEMQINTLKPIKVCFEFADINRQTTWVTIYDGRGVFAKNINLSIRVKDNNIKWIDVDVEYHKMIFHSGTKLPDSFNVVFSWKSENEFDSVNGYAFLLWLAMISSVVLVIGIIISSKKQKNEEIDKALYKQPEKYD